MHLSFLTSHNLLFSVCAKPLKKQHFRFLCRFFRKIVQISIFKVEYLENGLADFNDFGLILQDFEQLFRRNHVVLALQFSFKKSIPKISVLIKKWHVPDIPYSRSYPSPGITAKSVEKRLRVTVSWHLFWFYMVKIGTL